MSDLASPARRIRPWCAAVAAGSLSMACSPSIELEGTVPTLETTAVRAFADETRDYGAALLSGDFTDDGIDDLVLGCPGVGEETPGVVILLHGSDLGVIAVLSADLGSPTDAWRFGETLAVGDWNGDGWPDLAVGNPSATVDGLAEAGSVWIYSGPVSASSASIRVPDEPSEGGQFGSRLLVNDVDGDGVDDLLVASPGTGDAGAARVAVRLGPDLTEGWVMEASTLGSRFGDALAVSTASGDEVLIIGAPGTEDDDGVPRGAAYVYAAGDLNADPVSLRPAAGDDAAFGRSIALGDFDGDGTDDWAVSSLLGSGAVYFYPSGEITSPKRRVIRASTPQPGRLLTVRDVTDDGRDELLVLSDGTAPSVVLYSPGRAQTHTLLPFPIAAALTADVDGDGQDEVVAATPGGVATDFPGISVIRVLDFDLVDVEDLARQSR